MFPVDVPHSQGRHVFVEELTHVRDLLTTDKEVDEARGVDTGTRCSLTMSKCVTLLVRVIDAHFTFYISHNTRDRAERKHATGEECSTLGQF